MDFLHAGASLLLNSICFRPLPQSRYTFDFKHPDRKIFYIPVTVTTPSPAPASSTTSPSTTNKKSQQTYHVPTMLIPGKKNYERPANNIILHFHGTSGDIVKSSVWAQLQTSLPDYDILCVEFPGGYGTASPKFPSSSSSSSTNNNNDEFEPFFCSRESLMTIARGVTDFVINDMKIPESDLIFSGRSMGTGVAIELAARYYKKCAAVLLLSPYASMSRVIKGVVEHRIPPSIAFSKNFIVTVLVTKLLSFLCSFGRTSLFEPIQFASEIDCAKVWIAHGKKDDLIPIAHAEEIKSAIENRKDNKTNVELFVDPHGTHPEVNFNQPLAQFLNDFAEERKKANNVDHHQNRLPRLWKEAPVADYDTVQKLKSEFKDDVKTAAKFKSVSTKSLIFGITCSSILTAAFVSFYAVKFAIEGGRKLMNGGH